MPRETETEETTDFLLHSYHWWHSVGVGRAPYGPPWLRLKVEVLTNHVIDRA